MDVGFTREEVYTRTYVFFLLQSIKDLKCKGIHQSSKQQPDQNKTVLPIGIYEAQNLYARNRNIDHDLIDVYSHNERLKAERRIVA